MVGELSIGVPSTPLLNVMPSTGHTVPIGMSEGFRSNSRPDRDALCLARPRRYLAGFAVRYIFSQAAFSGPVLI